MKMVLTPVIIALVLSPMIVTAQVNGQNYNYRLRYYGHNLIGDFDHDCDVDWFDFGIFASLYGSERGDDIYRGWVDLNKDGIVDRYDFGIFAQNFDILLNIY